MNTSAHPSATCGNTQGSAYVHTRESIAAGLARSRVALPASLTGKDVILADFPDLPSSSGQAPVVVFLHGSSGLNPQLGYEEWQLWLARQGIASFMFDGMQLENRLTYQSPADKDVYEKIHALRASEIGIALDALGQCAWADKRKLFLAGTSEGGVAAARYDGDAFMAKMIYSWSCEDNYFVEVHRTSTKPIPLLNIMSSTDKYYSQANPFLGNAQATGNCQATFGGAQEHVQVVLLPDAPHTLINLPAARSATLGFIAGVLNAGIAQGLTCQMQNAAGSI